MINQSPQISVIVPVYNVEQYLSRCIDSVLAQTFTDFELLLIDDGSKDNSGIICDEYAGKDKRIRVFHKENGGVSSARNLGLDVACCEWITFIDSDDYVEDNFLEELFQSTNSDLKIGGYTTFGEKASKENYKTSVINKDKIGICLSKCLNDYIFRVPWAKLFRLSIINNSRLRFDSRMKIGEDTIFVQQYLCFCKSLSFINTTSYNYFSQNVQKKYQLSKSDLFYSLEIIQNAYNRLTEQLSFTNKDYIDFIYGFMLKLYFNFIGKQHLKFHEYKEFKHCFQYKMNVLSPYVQKRKFIYILLKHKYYLFAYIYINILGFIKNDLYHIVSTSYKQL